MVQLATWTLDRTISYQIDHYIYILKASNVVEIISFSPSLSRFVFPRGKFAVVKRCVEKATGKQYAAKFLRKRRKGTDCRKDVLNEIAVLELAKANPYVVELHEVYETSAEIILVLEW